MISMAIFEPTISTELYPLGDVIIDTLDFSCLKALVNCPSKIYVKRNGNKSIRI